MDIYIYVDTIISNIIDIVTFLKTCIFISAHTYIYIYIYEKQIIEGMVLCFLIRSDEGLTLETSALKLLAVAYLRYQFC